MGQHAKALVLHKEHKAIAKEIGDRSGLGFACVRLGICYLGVGQHAEAIRLLGEYKVISEEIGDQAALGDAYNNLGAALAKVGSYDDASRALVRGLAELSGVERNVGAQDDRRISMFEEQQSSYAGLQGVLLQLGEHEEQVGARYAEWALGVAEQAKARWQATVATRCAGHGGHKCGRWHARRAWARA